MSKIMRNSHLKRLNWCLKTAYFVWPANGHIWEAKTCKCLEPCNINQLSNAQVITLLMNLSSQHTTTKQINQVLMHWKSAPIQVISGYLADTSVQWLQRLVEYQQLHLLWLPTAKKTKKNSQCRNKNEACLLKRSTDSDPNPLFHR